jgi:hypothetical protein
LFYIFDQNHYNKEESKMKRTLIVLMTLGMMSLFFTNACLYAHGDKLSPKCEYALYDAAVQLERAVAALSYVANECDEDLDKYCSAVAPGEGRLLDCLNKKSNQLTKRCKQALKDVGLK